MTDINKLNLSKYDVISVEKLEDLDSTGLLLRHKKSGARIAIVSNDDNNKVFSIGFKTPFDTLWFKKISCERPVCRTLQGVAQHIS